jgi:SAM-dependent methyltransferase
VGRMRRWGARGVRSVLRRAAGHPRFRGAIERVACEALGALSSTPVPEDLYDASYFGTGRDPTSRQGLSGYERYDRKSSLGERLAYCLWRELDAKTALDVGCATGFLVEALVELGLDAYGVDVSRYAIDHAVDSVRGRVRRGDLLAGLDLGAGPFDLVTVVETLEHLPPDSIGKALAELRRLTRCHLVATIPSFGPNPSGPDGWLEGKVRPERLSYYRSLGPAYSGPVPYQDLMRDEAGRPVEGHLTICSYAWWQARFEEAGFERRPQLEARLYPHLERFGMKGFVCLYVLSVPSTPLPPVGLRSEEEIAEVERRWELWAYETASQ